MKNLLIADLWAECQSLGFVTMKREYWLVIGTVNRKESDLKVGQRQDMLKHTGWPEYDHDWLKHVALICLINVNINKFILSVNKCFFIIMHN
jgi:hypothetical protein